MTPWKSVDPEKLLEKEGGLRKISYNPDRAKSDLDRLLPGRDRFEIIYLIDAMIGAQISKLEKINLNIPDKIYFSCDRCGNCCRNVKYGIPVTIPDITNWIKNNRKIIVRALDYNTGHPTHTFFLITKADFVKYMIRNHGKSIYNKYLSLNPSLTDCGEDNSDCVFFNSESSECSIYNMRPLYCRLYPYFHVMDLDITGISSTIFKKISGMRPDRDFKKYISRLSEEDPRCSPERLEDREENLKKIKISRISTAMMRFIVGTFFSNRLYFENRRDVYEKVLTALFAR